MDSNDIKSIPYGLSDYQTLTRDNCYYVDKTHFIPLIEQAARFFFLIRPRRFGKSLLLSMLESYYDINNADRFEELFGERWIYQHPTRLRAKFLILRFNFSIIDIRPEKMEASFEEHCAICLLDFCRRYQHLLYPELEKEMMRFSSISGRLEYLNNVVSQLKLRIYLVLDEYDNFTNSMIATIGEDAYRDTTHGTGYFRHFFNVLKKLTTGSGMALERMFITGVSPVSMDDVTSGYNIGMNFTTDSQFNGLVGFSETELRTMLEYYHECGLLKTSVDETIEEIKPWYDNYCFAPECVGEYMFNSDMTLYYLNSCLRIGIPPREMIDKNIRTDYNKLRHIIKIDKELGENFSVIREVVERGSTVTKLNDSFPVEDMGKPDNFKSLLFYFGLLSIQSGTGGNVTLAIPNHTVREQMYSYLTEGYRNTNVFQIDFDKLGLLMEAMAYRGAWQPVFAYIASELEKQSRIREFINGEDHIKGFLLAYLGLTHYYQILPEYEMAKGYTDFFFQPNPQLTDLKYAYLMEVKYLKRDEPDSRIPALTEDARRQLLKYASDELVVRTLRQAELRLVTVVFRGWEVVEMEEVFFTPHTFS